MIRWRAWGGMTSLFHYVLVELIDYPPPPPPHAQDHPVKCLNVIIIFLKEQSADKLVMRPVLKVKVDITILSLCNVSYFVELLGNGLYVTNDFY